MCRLYEFPSASRGTPEWKKKNVTKMNIDFVDRVMDPIDHNTGMNMLLLTGAGILEPNLGDAFT